MKKSSQYNSQKPLTRRQAAKKFLVGGGVLGSLAATDGKWIKPVIKEAVLPAHADGSPPETW